MWARFSLAGLILAAIGMPIGAAPTPVQWQTTLETAKRLAAQNNQLVLVHFWAPFCHYCRQMEGEVLGDPTVAQVLQGNYVPVKVNTEQFPGTARQFGVTKLPTDVIILPNGQVVQKLEGMIVARDYANQLNQIAASARPQGAQPPMLANIPSGDPSRTMPGAGMPGMTPAPNNGYIANSPYGTQPGGVQPGGVNPAAPIGTPGGSPPVSPFSQGNPPAYASGPTGQAPMASGTPGAPSGAPLGVMPPSTVGMMPPTISATPGPLANPAGAPPATPNMPTESSRPNATSPASQPKPSDVASGSSPNTTPPSAADLPPGSPPLILDGYCPVELQERGAWVPGDKRYGVIHLNRTYLFSGYGQQQRFFTNPDKYAPVLSGMDVVIAVERNQMVPGERRYGGYHENKLYLFSSEESVQKFDRDPKRYISAAAQQTSLPNGNPQR